MIETKSAGDLGLDLLLGGGWRLVSRVAERPSATVLVRGGAGAGKTLFGFHAAYELAKALGGDVAVGCVELLPSEYAAQLADGRLDVPRSHVVVLPEAAAAGEETRVFCNLLEDLDPAAPDLVAALEDLDRQVTAAGGRPRVFVVDSLSDGYGLGASIARAAADAVMKFAAARGVAVVLCEESPDGRPSPWVFAADTVIELGVESRVRGRWIEVKKHRFGAAVSGRHELDLRGWAHPRVYVAPPAWLEPHSRAVLGQHRLTQLSGRGEVGLVWSDRADGDGVAGATVLIEASEPGLARAAARELLPQQPWSSWDLVFELDPLVVRSDDAEEWAEGFHCLSMLRGPARMLHDVLDRYIDAGGSRPRRVIVGDLAIFDATAAPESWYEMFQVLVVLTIELGWDVPFIAWTSSSMLPASIHQSLDSVVALSAPSDVDRITARWSSRWHRQARAYNWSAATFPRATATSQVPRRRIPHGRFVL